MRIVLTVIISLAIILNIAGCATIMKGNTQNLQINSIPSGAQIKINGIAIGTSPMIVKLSTKNEYSVIVELSGYLPYSISIKKSVSGWIWGSIFTSGILGLIIDYSSGAVYKLDKEQINAQLVKNGMGDVTPELDNVYIFATLKPVSTFEKIGQLTRSDK